MRMTEISPNKAGECNGATKLSLHVQRLGRAVPDLFRSVKAGVAVTGSWLQNDRSVHMLLFATLSLCDFAFQSGTPLNAETLRRQDAKEAQSAFHS